ncbi:MAG: GNAT family N-acetyltransferase [Promethearchaeota archaeon]
MMDNLSLAPAQQGQEEILANIHNVGFRECIEQLGIMYEFRENRRGDFKGLVLEPKVSLLVAFLDDIPVGYTCSRFVKLAEENNICRVMFEPTESNLGQSRIVVLPEYRRRGIASALIRTSLENAKEKGAEIAFIYSHSDNTAASALLTELGFVHDEVFYYPPYSNTKPYDHDNIYLELDLSQPAKRVPLNSDVKLKAPSVEDLPVLVRIFGECAPWAFGPSPSFEHVHNWLKEPWGEEQFAAVVDGEIVGVMEFSARGQLGVPGVLPEYQRRGIGTTLLYYLLKRMQEKGYRRVLAETGIIAKDAISLYHRLGFRQVRAQWRWHKILS